MKKVLAMILAAAMVIGLVACGGSTPAETTAAAAAEATTAAPAATTAAAAEATTAAPAETAAPETEAAAAEDPSETSHLTILWHQAGGTDGAFESMWYDYQSSIPDLLYDTLIKLEMEDTSQPVYRMADSYTMSDDGLTYTFHLRDGIKWHDGETVKASDVLFSWKAKCAGCWALSDDMTNATYIEGVQDFYDGKASEISGITVDGNNITFKLTQAYGGFLRMMALTAIFPEHCFTNELSKIKDDEFWKFPITCGPYKLVEVNYPDYCILERNDDWYNPLPGIKTVYGRSYDATGEEAAQNAMVAGELDLAHSNGFNDINVAENICSQNPDYKYAAFAASYIRYFSINQGESQDGKNNTKWTSNPKFRQAIDKALDKEAFASYFPGQAVALSTCINPGDPLYDSSIPLFQRDVDGAKALLDEIGYDGSSIRIAYYYSDQTTMDLMDLACQNLAEIGIPAEASLITGDITAALTETRNFDLLYGGLNSPSNADNYDGAGWTTGKSGDIRTGDVEYRASFYDPRAAIVSSSSDPAVISEPLNEMQQQGLIDCYDMPVISMNKMFIYNDAKWDFDETWLTCNQLALYKCCDLRLETWKLNY